MLTKNQVKIIEQATAKAGGKLSFEQKKSTRNVAVYFVRASNRPDARKNIQNFLKSKKINITEKKTSLSSENITEFVMGTYTGNDGGAIASQAKVTTVSTEDITIIKGTYLDGPFIAFKSNSPAVIYYNGDIIQTDS